MTRSFLRSALVLGLLSCVGPITIDMYLPAMPAVGADLGASVQATQMTVTVFFLAFGLAQIVYGPLADMYGRLRPLTVGLVLFFIGSVGCVFAPDMPLFLASRLLQGLGAAAIMVIPRAIIRDMHTGVAATRLMALVMLVISVSPMLAPLAGSVILLFGSWRLIFVVLALAAILSILMTLFVQPETLPPEKRVPVRLRAIGVGTRQLASDPVFMGLTFVGGFGMASFFVFLASAPFVYIGHYDLSPTTMSLAFSINALGFFGASQFAAPLGERFGMTRMMLWAATGFLAFALLIVALVAAGFGALWLLILVLVLANACLGLVIPTSMVMALDDHGAIAGLASSLGGMLQMVIGGVMTIVVAPFFDGSPLPLVASIAVCAALCCAVMVATVVSGRRLTPAA
ncbi:multidrug effflux MFS transporter [Pseudohoeflea coraliihabitans]|uniref:Bcr/CflA family efflux transporter n=1 Tax=Pseudohoeflea coraliihabitans TaxID=2860393 RepID=A0ABS6WN07_9HYPH|nr:multidrug effflux MFS transporter [Pseudohoeflea sp. DP4N28-3]MBW3097331.1 multidrug effflux MFS transporter [Pseudohoeflea sp. DP4N28-3]